MRHILRLTLILLITWPLVTPVTQAQEPAPQTTRPIRFWWPEELYGDAAAAVLTTFITDFNNSSSSFEVDYRVYVNDFEGQSPVAQLNLTNTVAPAAVPDLMVMRREHMITLVQNSLSGSTPNDETTSFSIVPVVLQSIEGWDTRPLLNEVAPLSQEIQVLGETNGILYGLPYLIEVQHTIASPGTFDTRPITIDDVLEAETPMLFAGRPRSGQVVNDMVLLLYTALGGQLIGTDGLPTLNEAALRQTLALIDEGLQRGVFSRELLNYRSPNDYLDTLIVDEPAYGVVDSSVFLRTAAFEDYSVGAVPLLETPLVLVDGWVWVLLTDDETRQSQAREFTGFMMETDQLVDISIAVDTLPIQERALNALDTDYVETVQNLLTSTIFVNGRGNQAALALQSAFEAVLTGDTPAEATTKALENLTTTVD